MNSPIASKINWTQIAGLVATALVYFGVKVSPEALVAIVVGIQSLVSVLTIIWRTFFTNPNPATK
jgi:hypothetical protein